VPSLTIKALSEFEITVLFYIFYNRPHDSFQIEAYNELINRKWHYHPKSNRWFKTELDDGTSRLSRGNRSRVT
jgi:CCR4-NOT transcriptional regulation complex NOT5 subunit